MVKNPSANAGDTGHGFHPWVRKGMEEGTATQPSIHALRTPWTQEPGGLQSMGLQRITTDMTEAI